MTEGGLMLMPNGTDWMSSMRSMTFHFSRTVLGGLLFAQWRIQSIGGLVGAVVAVFTLAILYEGLKTFREYLVFRDWKHWNTHRTRRRQSKSIQDVSRDSSDEEEDSTNDRTFVLGKRRHGRKCHRRSKGFRYYSISVSMHLLQSVLHVVQVGYAYLLMLVAMTYNGWLFLAVTFGAGVGYLLFAKSRHLMGNFREQNEHCHH